jgi:hypothetical protein
MIGVKIYKIFIYAWKKIYIHMFIITSRGWKGWQW